MDLRELGWDAGWTESFRECEKAGLLPGRVALEDKHHYLVLTEQGDIPAQVTGRLLHNSSHPAELPKVGDWVGVSHMAGENKALIHRVLPRRTRLSRKVTGRETEEQMIATNIDLVFVVYALDGSFNPRRLQRHLVMVYEGGARPVVVLNKSDLCAVATAAVEEAQRAAGEAPVFCVSARTGRGMENLASLIEPAMTVVFIGSSGVGKSSLVNSMCGEEVQPTLEVRESDHKGRHATSWREMVRLPNGGLVIDTPGTREFHMWMAADGVEEAFPDVEELAVGCHFRDCQHTVEARCAVKEAVEAGRLPRGRYENYLKLKGEIAAVGQARRKRAHLEQKRRTRIAQRAFNKPKGPWIEDEPAGG